MTRFFRKSKKKLFWGHFWAKWIFLEKDSVIFWIFQLSTTMQKTEKTNEPFLKKIPNWKTDRRTNGRQTDRRAGRQTDRQRWSCRTLRVTGFQKLQYFLVQTGKIDHENREVVDETGRAWKHTFLNFLNTYFLP